MKSKLKNFVFCLSLLSVLVLIGCEKPEEKVAIVPVSFSELPNWNSDKLTEVWPAFILSCENLKTQSSEPLLTNDINSDKWQNVCAKAKLILKPTDDNIRRFFEQDFLPYKISENKSNEGLFTGFYEPEMKGSRTKYAKFTVPVYKKPDDLITVDDLGIFKEELKGKKIIGKIIKDKLVPYSTRAEIEASGLPGNEILWVEDEIDNFFMHIAGAALVRLDNGEKIRLSYSSTNGRRYRAIGKILIEMKQLTPENVSMQSIKKWLKEHPEQAKEIMHKNDSFTFFSESKQEGPIGSQEVVLTSMRSLGINPKYIAYGTPIWLDVPAPDKTLNQERIQRLVIAQDEDGTIKGAIGGNLFCGTGEAAGELAGRLKSTGTFYLLLPL